ncbi:MAG: Asp/Glu racemase [Gammaproteobacteria bacterium]|nr:Asp/Glu racemase [Gammaproteobacteria bacterium]
MQTRYTQAAPAEPLEFIGGGGRIGVVALATDLNIEADLRRMAPDGVEILTNRVLNRNPLTADNLRAMAADISRAAAGILPGARIDALIYACTSGAAVIGEAEVMRLLRAGRAGGAGGDGHDGGADIPCTTPVTAALAAFGCFSARRISVLTPYPEAINRELAAFFSQRGLAVINMHGLGIENDTDMTGVTVDSITQAAADACHPDADLLFISCTALRAAQVIHRLETRLDKPVVSSNQALLWHALKLMKTPSKIPGFGRLFRH